MAAQDSSPDPDLRVTIQLAIYSQWYAKLHIVSYLYIRSYTCMTLMMHDVKIIIFQLILIHACIAVANGRVLI